MSRRKGQSILEYVIVLTVIIAAIAYAAKSYLSAGIQQGFVSAGDVIENSAKKLPTNP